MYIEIFQVALVLAACFCFQSVVGFGGGMLCIPLLMSMGYGLPAAIEFAFIAALFQSLLSAHTLRNDIPWSSVWLPASLRFFGLFAGMFILYSFHDIEKELLKQLVGVAIMALLCFQFFVRPAPKEKVSTWITVAACLGSGLCLGTVGMGGPPLIVWAMAHNWSQERTRGTLFAIYIPSLLVSSIAFPFTFGREVIEIIPIAFYSLPLIYLGMRLGMRLGRNISKDQLKLVAYSILFCVSLKTILEPYF